MNLRITTFLIVLALHCATGRAAEIWMGQDGIDVDGGSLGRFT